MTGKLTHPGPILEVERSDWMRTPGRNATINLGPFMFYVDTADGWAVAFGVRLGPIAVSWMASSNEDEDG